MCVCVCVFFGKEKPVVRDQLRKKNVSSNLGNKSSREQKIIIILSTRPSHVTRKETLPPSLTRFIKASRFDGKLFPGLALYFLLYLFESAESEIFCLKQNCPFKVFIYLFGTELILSPQKYVKSMWNLLVRLHSSIIFLLGLFQHSRG